MRGETEQTADRSMSWEERQNRQLTAVCHERWDRTDNRPHYVMRREREQTADHSMSWEERQNRKLTEVCHERRERTDSWLQYVVRGEREQTTDCIIVLRGETEHTHIPCLSKHLKLSLNKQTSRQAHYHIIAMYYVDAHTNPRKCIFSSLLFSGIVWTENARSLRYVSLHHIWCHFSMSCRKHICTER
jgi:hypothetical protein